MRLFFIVASALSMLAGFVQADTLTALHVVRPNTIIEAGDLGAIDQVIPGALPADANIVGLEARITLYPGRPILPGHVGPAALVERNQPVVVVFRDRGLTISADGRALSRGAEGETVRVMNLASRTTVSGKVQSDGSIVILPRGIIR